jgi:hypothetical protein
VGVVESAAVHANEITGHPDEALLRIGSRSRSTERYSSQLPEQGVIANRPAHLNSEAKLLQAGFGQADRVHGNTGERRDAVVVHHCANCDYLDHGLQQPLRSQAHMHSMDTCMRPGGGAHGASHEEARTRQYALDDMLLRSSCFEVRA